MIGREDEDSVERSRCMGMGMGLGMALFAPIGIIIALVTDTFGLLGIGPAMGVAVGVAIGEGLYQRRISKRRQGDDDESH